MWKRLRQKIHTWLIYKILCVFKWLIINFFVVGYHKIVTIVKAHYYDKKLGIETSDFVSFKNVRDSFRDGVYKDGELYEAISYDKLNKIFSYLPVTEDDVFVDFGCGKGRAVLYAAQFKLKKVIGVELKKELFDIAMNNLAHFKPASPVEFLNSDAAMVNVNEGTIFFLYNPFGPMTLSKVLSNIKQNLVLNPRPIRIVYFNSVYSDLLNGQDWLAREATIDTARDAVWRNKF